MNHTRLLGVLGLLAAGVGGWLGSQRGTAADPPTGQLAVTGPIVLAIRNEALKQIDLALRKPSDKTSAQRIRCNAFMIALAAQDAMAQPGANVPELAALRAAAVELAEAARGKKVQVDKARPPAARLRAYPALKPGAGAVPERAELLKRFDMADIMRVFEKPIKGGQGVEVQMINLENVRRTYKPKQLKDWEPSALKTVLIAEFVRHHQPEGPAKQKQWQGFCEDMAKTALQTLHASQAKDSKQFRQALKKLNDSCTACHDVFK